MELWKQGRVQADSAGEAAMIVRDSVTFGTPTIAHKGGRNYNYFVQIRCENCEVAPAEVLLDYDFGYGYLDYHMCKKCVDGFLTGGSNGQ